MHCYIPYRNLTCFNRCQLYISSKFNVSGFIPINTRQQRASSAQGHRLQVKMTSLMFFFLWRNYKTISNTIKYAPLSDQIGGNRKRSEQSLNADHRSLETVFSIVIEIWQSKTTMTHIRMMRKHLCLRGMLDIIQSKITRFWGYILLSLLCSMSLISPNFDVKSIIFPQFWPGAFSENCWKNPSSPCKG